MKNTSSFFWKTIKLPSSDSLLHIFVLHNKSPTAAESQWSFEGLHGMDGLWKAPRCHLYCLGAKE
jgi:hypothetical protein